MPETLISINNQTINAIRKNVNKASSPQNIVFWSPDQYDIISDFKKFKRVLFTPHKTGYSTGKTVLMAYCAKELSKNNEKVLFVLANSETHNSMGLPSLQHMKLQKYFRDCKNVTLIGNKFGDPDYASLYMKQNPNLTREQLRKNYGITKADDFDSFEEKLKKEYKDHHIFIDELHGQDFEGKRDFQFDLYDRISKWSSKIIDHSKHFWVVSYELKYYNDKRLKPYFQKRPTLKIPLRNTAGAQIVRFCQTKSGAVSKFDLYDH